MEIHNTTEDIVVSVVHTIFEEIHNSGNPEKFCLCYQCRVDTICFTLNRVEPHYIVSNRGMSRIEQTSIKQQQIEADITTLVYKGIRLVNHNLRPTAPHNGTVPYSTRVNSPVFDIPTIAGRIFNGVSFEPVKDIEIGLYCDGELVSMRNSNWQNPFYIVASTPGAFSFWPSTVIAEYPETNQVFKYSVKVKSPDYEPLRHFFSVSATSKFHTPHSYALNRTFKLPDLYIFPQDGEDKTQD